MMKVNRRTAVWSIALVAGLAGAESLAGAEAPRRSTLSRLEPVASSAVPASVRKSIGGWATTAKAGGSVFFVSMRADKLLLIQQPAGLIVTTPWKPRQWMREKLMTSDEPSGRGWLAVLGNTPVLLLESGFAYSGHDHSVSFSNLHAFVARGRRLAHLNWIPLQEVTISDDRDSGPAAMCVEGAAETHYTVHPRRGGALEIVRLRPKTYEIFAAPTKRGQAMKPMLRLLLGASRSRSKCRVGRRTAACVVVERTRYRLSPRGLRRRPARGPQPWIAIQSAQRLLKLIVRRYEHGPRRLKGLPRAEAFGRCFAMLAELRPDLAGAHYHHAGMLARGHTPKNALAPLRRALTLSPDYAAKARSDEDLDALRALPEFRRLVEGKRALR